MGYFELAKDYVEALGGLDNIKTIDNCITRLRLEMVDMTKVDDDKIIALGSKGTVYVGQNKFHLIIGANVVCIADEMHNLKGDGALTTVAKNSEDYNKTAKEYIQALGGAENLEKIDNCITRLRLTIKDMSKVNESDLEKLDNKGVVHKSDKELHVVIGLKVTSIADEMRSIA